MVPTARETRRPRLDERLLRVELRPSTITVRFQTRRSLNGQLQTVIVTLQLTQKLVERRSDGLGKLDGVIVGPEMHEEHSRLLQQHMTVERGHLDAFARSALSIGFTSSPVITKSPVIAALPPPVSWKLIAFAVPIAVGIAARSRRPLRVVGVRWRTFLVDPVIIVHTPQRFAGRWHRPASRASVERGTACRAHPPCRVPGVLDGSH